MKRYSILLVMAFAAIVTTHAQESALGFEFGYAQTDMRLNQPLPIGDINAKTLYNTALNGFKVGIMWDATYIKGFGSTLGIRYTYGTALTDWAKVDPSSISEYPRTKQRLNYNQLELYVDWQYKFEIAAHTYIILTSGPSIQCGLSMNNTLYYQEYDGTEQKTITSRYDYSGSDLRNAYNRINVTWGVGAGFQYKRFFLRGGYDFGLMNPYKIGNFNEVEALVTLYGADYSQYTRGRIDQWHIRLGFYFAQFDK